MVDHNVHRETVAVGGDDAGDHKEQRPEHYKDRFQDQQPEQARHQAETVQQVSEVGRVFPDGIQREDREPHTHDRKREMKQEVDQRFSGSGHGTRHQLHRRFRPSL